PTIMDGPGKPMPKRTRLKSTSPPADNLDGRLLKGARRSSREASTKERTQRMRTSNHDVFGRPAMAPPLLRLRNPLAGATGLPIDPDDEIADALPDVRSEKVAAMRKAIASGRYRVDAKAVAERI